MDCLVHDNGVIGVYEVSEYVLGDFLFFQTRYVLASVVQIAGVVASATLIYPVFSSYKRNLLPILLVQIPKFSYELVLELVQVLASFRNHFVPF